MVLAATVRGFPLTYDITVPEPGAALREIYAQIADLQAQAASVFSFDLQYADITPDDATLEKLSQQYGVQLPPPPAPTQLLTVGGTQVTGIDPGNPGNRAYWPLNFTVPDGYWVTDEFLAGELGNNPQSGNNTTIDIIGWSQLSGQTIGGVPVTGQEIVNQEFPTVDLTNFL